MTISAHDVAVELRRRLPGLGRLKLQKLLYYCQGHHLASFDEPLFAEGISAWDLGPVVADLWLDERSGQAPAPNVLDDRGLNTIGYVISRYGQLSGNELMILTHNQSPWQLANEFRRPGTPRPIPNDSIQDYFRRAAAFVDPDDAPRADPDAIKAWLTEAPGRALPGPPEVDDLEALRRRLAQGRAAS